MIHLTFSYWWWLLPLAILLVGIVASCNTEGGIGAGLKFLFVAGACLAVFLIALACMVGYHFGHA